MSAQLTDIPLDAVSIILSFHISSVDVYNRMETDFAMNKGLLRFLRQVPLHFAVTCFTSRPQEHRYKNIIYGSNELSNIHGQEECVSIKACSVYSLPKRWDTIRKLTFDNIDLVNGLSTICDYPLLTNVEITASDISRINFNDLPSGLRSLKIHFLQDTEFSTDSIARFTNLETLSVVGHWSYISCSVSLTDKCPASLKRITMKRVEVLDIQPDIVYPFKDVTLEGVRSMTEDLELGCIPHIEKLTLECMKVRSSGPTLIKKLALSNCHMQYTDLVSQCPHLTDVRIEGSHKNVADFSIFSSTCNVNLRYITLTNYVDAPREGNTIIAMCADPDDYPIIKY
jgi:hypothetical protein